MNIKELRKFHQIRAQISNFLQKHGMQNCRAVPAPQATGSAILANEGNPVDKKKHQALGSLTDAVTAIRPDIARPVKL